MSNYSSNGKLMNAGKAAWNVYCALEQMQSHQRAREQDARIQESLQEASRVRAFIEREEASGKLGNAGLGTYNDAHRLGMFDNGGLFLGGLEGRPIFYNGRGHLLNYAPTQSGKGRDIALPNLAHVANRSFVVSDIKNGENAFATAAHRKHTLKHRTIPLNPYGLLGVPSFRLNPFSRLVTKAQSGSDITVESIQAAMSLVAPKQDDNAWVSNGAQEILALRIEYLALYRPEQCTLSGLWRYVNAPQERFREATMEMMACGNDVIGALAERALTDLTDAPEQFRAYSSEMTTALRMFRPESELAIVTDKSDFDPGSLRHELATVYLMTPEHKIEASARWIALVLSSILETCANTPGPVPVCFLIDELANLPYMPIIPKALTLYAGLGVQLWGLCQGRESLRASGYKDATIKTFEQQAGVLHMWGVEDPQLIQDIELWSGKTSVAIRGANNSGGAVSSASFGISEHARSVLQPENIRAVDEGRQIIRMRGNDLFIADRIPWFTVPRWASALKDVRTLHYQAAKPLATPAPPMRQIAAPVSAPMAPRKD